MARVKRGKTATKKRKEVLKHTKGFKWGRKSKERAAKEALLHAWTHAFRGRKEKKRNYRSLWNVRIDAAARNENTKYSEFMGALKKGNILVNRKMLADLAKNNPDIFKKIAEEVVKK